jgi:hypothetical protein
MLLSALLVDYSSFYSAFLADDYPSIASLTFSSFFFLPFFSSPGLALSAVTDEVLTDLDC